MTRQEVFDRVARHLILQNRVSLAAGLPPSCRYRGHSGLQCAIGCLIEDDEYTPEMEGHSIDSALWANWRKRLAGNDSYDNLRYLIYGLRSIHDRAEPASWPKKLRLVAGHYGIDPAVIDTALAERERKVEAQ